MKNEVKTVYNSIYYDSQWKMSKKNDWRVVYSLIYNVSQSKIEWKMSKKNI